MKNLIILTTLLFLTISLSAQDPKLSVEDNTNAQIEFKRGTASGAVEQNASGGALRLQHPTVPDSSLIQLRTYGHSYFNGGNVGIGTISPAARLDVKGTTKVGLPGEGNVLLDLNSERNWVFRQLNTGQSTSLELASIGGSGNKAFFINTLGTFGITHMNTVITADVGNVVRRSDGTLAVRQYALGDTAHGGLVFRLDESGEHGLVCSFTDLKTSTNDDTPHWSTAIANLPGLLEVRTSWALKRVL